MSRTTFEKLGIPYEERDGIFYPVLVAGTEKADMDAGKYGRMWIKYIREEYPMRYKSLVRFGELEERADEVNDTAYELLDDIEAKWLKKHKKLIGYIKSLEMESITISLDYVKLLIQQTTLSVMIKMESVLKKRGGLSLRVHLLV